MPKRKSFEIAMPVVELVSIDKIKPWDRNPRTKHAVSQIAKSIESFGYLSPIIVQRGTYRTLAGHGRLKALKSKGVKKIPVIVADISDKNADAYTLADNKITMLSGFDFAGVGQILKGLDNNLALVTGFSDAEIADMGKIISDVQDAASVGDALHRVTFYAGDDKATKQTVTNDNSLVIVFDDKTQLQFVRKQIRKLQAGSEKSIGQIIYERFTANANPPAT